MRFDIDEYPADDREIGSIEIQDGDGHVVARYWTETKGAYNWRSDNKRENIATIYDAIKNANSHLEDNDDYWMLISDLNGKNTWDSETGFYGLHGHRVAPQTMRRRGTRKSSCIKVNVRRMF